MLLSSRARDFAQNFELDLSRGVPGSESQLFNTLKKHKKSEKSTISLIILPLQGTPQLEHPSLFPAMMVFDQKKSELAGPGTLEYYF